MVNVTWLSATLLVVNCPDYYCDNVAIKRKALHQNSESYGPGDECIEITSQGKCIKTAIHFVL